MCGSYAHETWFGGCRFGRRRGKTTYRASGSGAVGRFSHHCGFSVRAPHFFVYGFAKSERDNIREDELSDFKKLAKSLLEAEEIRLQDALDLGELIEVKCDEEDLQD